MTEDEIIKTIDAAADTLLRVGKELVSTRARLKEAEETLEFYADVGRWIRRSESVDLSKTSAAFKGYSETIETKSWRPAGITICDRGEKARNYFTKYPAKEEFKMGQPHPQNCFCSYCSAKASKGLE